MSEEPQLPAPPTFEPKWLAPSDVQAWLKLNAQPEDDTALVTRVCASTEPYVERCRPEFLTPGIDDAPATYVPDAEAYHGAVMYAAREYRRRNSPAGVQSFGEAGVSFVSRYDSDIERALRTGAWTRPGVG